MKKILLLIREIIASIFLKNIIINLLLGLLFYFINHNPSKGNLYYVLLGALLAIFTTINIEETYKSIKKEENWQNIRCFYYLLYFEQLEFIFEGLKNKNLKLTSKDKQSRPYIAIDTNTDKKIDEVINDLTCNRNKKINNYLNESKMHFERLLCNAIKNIEKYATRKDVLDKVLEAKEFIILLKQYPEDMGLLISFLKISRQLFSLIKIELFLHRCNYVRIGKNLTIEGTNKENAWGFKSIEYTLNDFWQETLFKACRWYCRNIC